MYHQNQSSSELRELLALFPHKVVRPAQAGALEIIARMFTERARFAMVEAPPGVGKSALAVAAARYATTLGDEAFGPGAYILTPYNNLAMQMTGCGSRK